MHVNSLREYEPQLSLEGSVQTWLAFTDNKSALFEATGRIAGGTMRTHRRKTSISGISNILMFENCVGLDVRNKSERPAPRQLKEAERMSAIGRMACSISHDMRHSLTAIYANAELLERHDRCARGR